LKARAMAHVLELSSEIELATARLRLRAPRRGDVDALDEAIRESLPELVPWLPWAHAAHGRADTRRYLRAARSARTKRNAYEWIALAAAGDRVVGIASIHRIDWSRRSAGLGYWIRRSEWGRGYATEMARAVVEDAIGRMHLHRIEAHVALDNRASQRVPEKLGFLREGIAREVEFVNGRWLDHVQYSLLEGDPVPADAGGEE
jgi:ribosomal-protein-serine acetyltransferase